MIQIPQSTSRVVMLKLFTTGTTTAATGKTVALTISKAGAAFGNPNAGATNATEVSSGWYKVTLDTTDTNTVGDLVVRGTATGCDDTERVFGVVKATTGGLTALPDTAATTNASLLTSGTGTDQLSVSAGKVLLQATQAGVTIPTVTTLTNAPSDPTGVTTLLTRLPSAISLSAGAVTVGTNNDKTGYSLSQSFPTNFSALGINASGHVSRVTLADTVTTYTGNTPQTGDSYARIGATGSGLTSLASAANLATVAGYLDTEIAAIQTATVTDIPATLATIAGYIDTEVGAIAAQLVKVLAAVYDDAAVSGSTITLSNGAVLTVTASGRTRTGG